MAYIGNVPAEAYTNTVKDSFNGTGSATAFTLSQPTLTNDVRVVVENVVQDPAVAYNVSGVTLTFTSAPPSGTDNIYVVHLGPAVMTTVPPAEIAGATTFASSVSVQGAFTSLGIDDNATSTAITIDASENVGIGTSSPSANLHVLSSGDAIARVTSADGSGAFLDLGDASDPDGGRIVYDSGSNLTFSTASTERMRITSAGNVGIATSSPSYPVSVQSNSSAKALLILGRSSDDIGEIAFRENDNSTVLGELQYRQDHAILRHRVGYLSFATGGTSERMRVDASGNVLVNTTSIINSSILSVDAGNLRNGLSVDVGANSGFTCLYLDRTASNGVSIAFARSGTSVGSISVTTSATAYNTSSDYRLKENVTPIQGAADTVMAMQPCTYTAIADGVWYDGFLAHELQEVHPRAVTGTKDAMQDEEYEVTPAVYEDVVTPAVDAVAATYDDEGLELTPAVEAAPETTESVLVTEAVMGTRSVPDMQSVDYSKLTPILTAALQEALAEITALKSRVTALETE